jgi:tetratricopeptide (TPR) repeat protein
LEFCLKFVEDQFGNGDGHKSYHVADWQKDIVHYTICYALSREYLHSPHNTDMNSTYRDTLTKAIHCFEKALTILESWRTYFDSEEVKTNYINSHLSRIEDILSYSRMNRHDKAEDCIDKAIFHANASIEKSEITER